jgi:chaperonin cofactor prefoldin
MCIDKEEIHAELAKCEERLTERIAKVENCQEATHAVLQEILYFIRKLAKKYE